MEEAHRRSSSLILAAALWLAASIAGADSGANHQLDEVRPTDLGVSGGNINDRTSQYCCGGTLGTLVQDSNGTRYVLSNNHVLARSNQAAIGEQIIQPGLIDQTQVCSQDTTDVVGLLSDFVPIQFKTQSSTPLNEADAAIAQVTAAGAFPADGAILDIGPVSAHTVAATVGKAVQKSGRTTGQTFGQVSAVGVTVDVGYSTQCGGAATNVGRFINQISVTPGTFSAGGDSGSLIVESGAVDPTDGKPRAVGLLFAGSSSSTIGAPIDRALSLLGVTMLAGASQPTTGTVSGHVTNAANGSAIAGATVSSDSGQTATTGTDGAYTLDAVPAGSRQVTASASGFTTQTKSVGVQASVTSTLDFALQSAAKPTKAIAECITYNVTGAGNPNRQTLSITTRVLNDFGAPVSGARVTGSVKRGTTQVASPSATTNSSGNATFTLKNAANGSYVTTVTGISATGLTFEGTTPANLFRKGTDPVPDTDCRGDAPQPSGATEPSDGTVGPRGRAAHGSPAWSHAHQVKARHEDELFAVDGVVGVGLGRGDDGSPQIKVFLDSDRPESRRHIPHQVEDVSTDTVVTGPFTAY